MPDGIGDRLLILVRGQGEGLPGTRVREPTAICVRSGNIVSVSHRRAPCAPTPQAGPAVQGPGRAGNGQARPTPTPGGGRVRPRVGRPFRKRLRATVTGDQLRPSVRSPRPRRSDPATAHDGERVRQLAGPAQAPRPPQESVSGLRRNRVQMSAHRPAPSPSLAGS